MLLVTYLICDSFSNDARTWAVRCNPEYEGLILVVLSLSLYMCSHILIIMMLDSACVAHFFFPETSLQELLFSHMVY